MMGKRRRQSSIALAGAITTGALVASGMVLGEVIRSQVVAPTRARTLLDTTVQFTARGTVILPGVHKSWTPLTGIRTARSVYRLGPLSEPVDPSRTSGCERPVTRMFGPEEAPGTYGARFYTYQWFSAKEAGLNERFEAVPTPYGTAPAKIWTAPQVAQQSDTWVIGVHGRSAVHEELLRMATISCSRGFPFMAISYRNDQVGGPHTDGVSRMGSTEWEDLDWAIRHAQQSGAKRVILLGASQGASLIGYWLAKAKTDPDALVSNPSGIAGVILDSPLIRGSAALRAAIHSSGVPSGVDRFLTMATSGWMGVRGPQHVITVNHLNTFKTSNLPTLLFVGMKDTMMSPEPALRLSKADHVTSVIDDQAEHVEVYNESEETYTEVMAAWLEHIADPIYHPSAPVRSGDHLPPFTPDETDDSSNLETEQIVTRKHT
ncbi:hypothetical protein [Stomatohabitans albus]|uniref:hypothetical protein n=1 Tax=Stomatohabitans albus TaxID=3110766 RepID=UPI00300C5EEB